MCKLSGKLQTRKRGGKIRSDDASFSNNNNATYKNTTGSVKPTKIIITTLKNILPQVIKTSLLNTGELPSNPKNANVTPVFKKNNPLNKENYRPVSVLPIISEVFEKFDAKSNKFLHKIFFFPRTCVVTERALIVNML